MIRLVPVLLALAVLGAHFYRAGELVPLVGVLACVALVAVPKRWAARVLEVVLVLGAVEWLRTLAAIAAERQSLGQPWLRMAAILGVVALLTAACALVFRSPALRRRFGGA